MKRGGPSNDWEIEYIVSTKQRLNTSGGAETFSEGDVIAKQHIIKQISLYL